MDKVKKSVINVIGKEMLVCGAALSSMKSIMKEAKTTVTTTYKSNTGKRLMLQ